MTINGNFSISSINFCLDTEFLGSVFKPYYICNYVIMNYNVCYTEVPMSTQFQLTILTLTNFPMNFAKYSLTVDA